MVGEDKYENEGKTDKFAFGRLHNTNKAIFFPFEELIKWGYHSLVWFHVDKLSSAHIYLELREDQTIDDIPKELLDDCVQLVKANSIQGNKLNNIDVVYTLWSNLKKTNDMVVGQVRDEESSSEPVTERFEIIGDRPESSLTTMHANNRSPSTMTSW